MHALADWITKLVQILYCIKIDIFVICNTVDQADCNSGPFCILFVSLLVDLYLSGWGQKPRELPLLRTALCSSKFTTFPTFLKFSQSSYLFLVGCI